MMIEIKSADLAALQALRDAETALGTYELSKAVRSIFMQAADFLLAPVEADQLLAELVATGDTVEECLSRILRSSKCYLGVTPGKETAAYRAFELLEDARNWIQENPGSYYLTIDYIAPIPDFPKHINLDGLTADIDADLRAGNHLEGITRDAIRSALPAFLADIIHRSNTR